MSDYPAENAAWPSANDGETVLSVTTWSRDARGIPVVQDMAISPEEAALREQIAQAIEGYIPDGGEDDNDDGAYGAGMKAAAQIVRTGSPYPEV